METLHTPIGPNDEFLPMIHTSSSAPSPGFEGNATGVEEPSDPDIAVAASWKSMFAFTTTRHVGTIIPAWVLAVAAGAIKPTSSIFLGFIFDVIAQYVAGSIDHAALMRGVSKWCIVLVGLGVGSWSLNGAFFALWVIFGETQAKDVREKMFNGLLKRDMEWYDLRKDGISSLLVRIQTLVRDLQMATSQPLGFFIQDIAAALAAVGIALYYSWKLTLVLATSIPIAVGVLLLISRRLQPAIEAQKRELNQASQYANTAINAVDTVKVFNGQDHEVRQYIAAIKTAANSYRVQANANAMQMGFSYFLLTVMFMAGFWYGLVLYRQGGTTPGSILTTFYAYLMANQAVESLLPQWLVLSKGMSAGETLKQLIGEINHERGVARITGSKRPESCAGDIEVSNVTFAYPSNPTQTSLTDVTFFFPAGETTFLFGRSGSGKSTLSNLLLRFYAPRSGSITIDSQPIQTLDEKWLRNNVTLVQQQSVLFNETLFQNVAFGRQNGEAVTRNDVLSACQMALLSEVIHDLPQGLDTIIGSSGDTLSGGQKQRVAIARAILRESPILILDEVTSALDHTNRTLVMEAIRQWRMGKTTIIITHDASQIYDKDFVYVMDHGRVVEEGYRKALEKSPFGLFTSLVHDQSDMKDSEAELIAMRPITEEGASMNPTVKEPEHFPFSVMESLANLEGAESTASNTESTTLIHRLSSFFVDNPGNNLQTYRHNKRASLGIPSMYANTMRAGNALGRPSDPSFQSWRSSANLQQPVPSLPAPDYKRRSLRPLSHYAQIDMGSYDIAQSAPENNMRRRPGTNRQLSPERSGRSRSNEEYPSRISGQPPGDKKYKKQSQELKPASLTTIFTTVWPNLSRRDRVKLILGFTFAFVNAGCTPAFSYMLAKLLNTFYSPLNQAAEARKYALIILSIAVATSLSSYTFHYLLEICGRTWVDALRQSALSRILAQPRAWFDDPSHSPHTLTNILDRNAEEMRNLLGRFAGYAFLAASMVFIAVLWAFIVCWKLTLVGLAAAPAIYLLTRIFEHVSGAWERRTDSQGAVISSIYAETFVNIRVVRAMTLETHFQAKHGRAVQVGYGIGVRRGLFTGMLFGISDACTLFLTALIFYYGAVLVESGAFAFESVIACVTLLLFGIGNAKDILAFIPQISAARATATAMLHLSSLPLPPQTGTRTLASPLPIQLHNLSFAYPLHPTHRVLRNVSLSFSSRTSTAIVGPSGSGKSTLAALLLGLYPPSPSTSSIPPLTFGHVALPSLSLARLRTHMALVPQFPILFPASITANIVYGLSPSSPYTSRDSVVRAAMQAGIHEFVASLPQGYETKVGEGGAALSGGQMMRVAIARALVRRPRVLVLDEPTAGLDAEAAEGVAATVKGLVEAGSEVAVVVVTHDVRLMKRAGRIVVLERGVLVEEGGWEELRWRGGALSKLLGAGELR